MRCITYAGEHLVTSDAVADLLVALTASLAAGGRAEAVRIPIYAEGETYPGSEEGLEIVQLVVGAGTDVLSSPYDWQGPDPEFSEAVTDLQSKLSFHTPRAVISPRDDGAAFDHDLYLNPLSSLDPDPTIF